MEILSLQNVVVVLLVVVYQFQVYKTTLTKFYFFNAFLWGKTWGKMMIE